MKPIVLAGLLFTVGCATHAPAATSPQPASSSAAVRKDIKWFRSSAEYRGIALEVYRTASDKLPELSRGLANGTWAVILDADETVLDNSLHERELADRNESFTEAGWTVWVRQRAATAVPGAVEFTARVHALGGRVAIVTNRADSLCGATRDNLKSVGIVADVVLCKRDAPTDKNPRFQQIQNGTAASGLPALMVVAWFGDNIQDFPNLTQSIRTASSGYADFGVRYFSPAQSNVRIVGKEPGTLTAAATLRYRSYMNRMPDTIEPDAPASSTGEMMFSLLGAAHALEARLEEQLAQVGLSMSKLGVLTQLVEAGKPLALSELAVRLSCVRSNMTQLVDRLEADKLVRRVDDPEDRRSVLAMVTPLGEARQAVGALELEKVREQFAGALPLADRDVLARALAALAPS